MKKRNLLIIIVTIILGIITTSFYINIKEQEIASLAFTKDGQIVENLEELPQGAQELIVQYKEAIRGQLTYIKAARLLLIFAVVLLAIQYGKDHFIARKYAEEEAGHGSQ